MIAAYVRVKTCGSAAGGHFDSGKHLAAGGIRRIGIDTGYSVGLRSEIYCSFYGLGHAPGPFQIGNSELADESSEIKFFLWNLRSSVGTRAEC